MYHGDHKKIISLRTTLSGVLASDIDRLRLDFNFPGSSVQDLPYSQQNPELTKTDILKGLSCYTLSAPVDIEVYDSLRTPTGRAKICAGSNGYTVIKAVQGVNYSDYIIDSKWRADYKDGLGKFYSRTDDYSFSLDQDPHELLDELRSKIPSKASLYTDNMPWTGGSTLTLRTIEDWKRVLGDKATVTVNLYRTRPNPFDQSQSDENCQYMLRVDDSIWNDRYKSEWDKHHAAVQAFYDQCRGSYRGD